MSFVNDASKLFRSLPYFKYIVMLVLIFIKKTQTDLKHTVIESALNSRQIPFWFLVI